MLLFVQYDETSSVVIFLKSYEKRVSTKKSRKISPRKTTDTWEKSNKWTMALCRLNIFFQIRRAPYITNSWYSLN